MHLMTIHRLPIILFVLLLGLIASVPKGSAYPTKPVTMIVVWAPGGPTDLVSRALAEAAKPYFPQPITVVNKPGGGGAIGTAEVIQARPDGYTLGITAEGVIVIQTQLQQLPFKGVDDIEPLLGPVVTPTMFMVRSEAPWKTMQEVVDYVKANPGKLTVGVSGVGTETFLAVQAIMRQAKLEMKPVPLEGAGPIVAALLGGHVDTALTSGPPSIGHVRAGKIKYLSVAYPSRIKWAPDVPTMRELGLEPKVFYITRFFFFGPKRIPEEVLRFIRSNLGKAYQSEMFQKVCDDNILIPLNNTPEEMRKQFTEDYHSVSEFSRGKK